MFEEIKNNLYKDLFCVEFDVDTTDLEKKKEGRWAIYNTKSMVWYID